MQHTLVGFDEEQMKIIQSYRAQEAQMEGEIKSLQAELNAAKINLVAYGEEITRLQKLANYYEELYTSSLRDSKAIEEACIKYHDALKSIADSHPAIVDGKEWRMERQDAIQRAKAALEAARQGKAQP